MTQKLLYILCQLELTGYQGAQTLDWAWTLTELPRLLKDS